jgi:hypothetical protein
MFLFCDRVGIALEFDFRMRERTGISDFGQITPGASTCLQNRAACLQLPNSDFKSSRAL